MRDALPDTIRATEALIGKLMPTAMDMVASVVEAPQTSMDGYEQLVAVAEQSSPLLLLAVLRVAAGFAAIADMSAADVRSLIDLNVPVEPSHNID